MGLSEGDRFDFPDKEGLKEAIGQNRITTEMYTDLRILTDIINQQDEPISVDHLVYKAKTHGDYSVGGDEGEAPTGPDENRLEKLYKWDISISKWVAGDFPSSKLWVDLALNEIGAASVTEDNLNDVQQKCSQLGNIERENYYRASGREFQEKILNSTDDVAREVETVGEFVDTVVEKFADLAAAELPRRTTSINNGALSLAGSANEEIVVRSLQSAGLKLVNNTDGDFTTTTEDADLIVFSANGSEMRVEIKSTAVRERASRAMMGEGRGWALFGFFEDAAEIRSGILFGNQQGQSWTETTQVAYAPPKKVAEVRDLDEQMDDGHSAYSSRNEEGALFLRANNVFPRDMIRFTEHSKLSDLDEGHETEFLSSD